MEHENLNGDLSSMLRKDVHTDPDGNPLKIQRGDDNPVDPANILKAATGLNIDEAAVKKAYAEQRDHNANGKERSLEVLTPEEAAQLGIVKGEKFDVDRDIARERNAKIDRQLQQKNNDMVDLLKGVAQDESKRTDRLTDALHNDEERKKIFNGEDPAENNGKVTYRAPIGDTTDNADVDATVRTTRRTEIDEGGFASYATPRVDPDDLVPSYDYEEEENEPSADGAESNEEERPTAEQSDSDYAKYIKTLEVSTVEEAEDPILVTVKKKAKVEPVSSGRMSKSKIVQDQAFLNAVNKFKRDNFRVVNVPLVNSGFSVDVVGTGPVDLTLLYRNIGQNTNDMEYELERMRTVLRNVVASHPQVDKNDLRNLIHFSDYNMLVYGHIAATLKDVEHIHTCVDCGKDFHIVANSADLILNRDKLQERIAQLRNCQNVNDIKNNSLMITNQQVITSDGFIINLGHPSYYEYIQYMTEMRDLANNNDMSDTQKRRLGTMAGVISYVRSVIMPNGIHTNSLFQRFIAMTMLDEDDFSTVLAEIKKLADQIVVPRFGIKSVKCPYCGKENTDITYDNLSDLLFFHTTVTRLMNETDL